MCSLSRVLQKLTDFYTGGGSPRQRDRWSRWYDHLVLMLFVCSIACPFFGYKWFGWPGVVGGGVVMILVICLLALIP